MDEFMFRRLDLSMNPVQGLYQATLYQAYSYEGHQVPGQQSQYHQ